MDDSLWHSGAALKRRNDLVITTNGGD